jgi:hypothetical protein
MSLRKTHSTGRNLLVRAVALVFIAALLAFAWLLWPAVQFLYHERMLAESVRKYSQTSGIFLTPDNDVRSYLVKLARYHRLNLSEGDVEIDYLDNPGAFGVPTHIGYTLSVVVDFRGIRSLPLVAQRSFDIAGSDKAAR